MATIHAALELTVRCALDRRGIDPNLAEAQLAPWAHDLTPATIDRLMARTTWGPNAGGGAKLTHLLRELEAEQRAQNNAEVRAEQRFKDTQAKARAIAEAVRAAVAEHGIGNDISLWVDELPADQRVRKNNRAGEYLRYHAGRSVWGIVAAAYDGDLLTCDWAAAIAWADDTKHCDPVLVALVRVCER